MPVQSFLSPEFIVIIILLAIWEVLWKGLAGWKAARNGHKTWFWGIIILNTVGILPIIYLAFFSKKKRKK